VDNIIICVDHKKEGAAANRERGLQMVNTEYTAFLDDDDELLPDHIETLLRVAKEGSADYTWAWFDVIGGTDPFPDHFDKQWDPDNPHQTTITTLVRTELAQQVGFLNQRGIDPPDGNTHGEDWSFTLGMSDIGAKMVHVPRRTWIWHHTDQNTSGRPDRW
jgi:glycosyltransferase involved in cell wall biosynthesis